MIRTIAKEIVKGIILRIIGVVWMLIAPNNCADNFYYQGKLAGIRQTQDEVLQTLGDIQETAWDKLNLEYEHKIKNG